MTPLCAPRVLLTRLVAKHMCMPSCPDFHILHEVSCSPWSGGRRPIGYYDFAIAEHQMSGTSGTSAAYVAHVAGVPCLGRYQVPGAGVQNLLDFDVDTSAS